MESVWDKIEQCEKRLNDMEGTAVPQPDQGDSATDDQVKVCKNVFLSRMFYSECSIYTVHLFVLACFCMQMAAHTLCEVSQSVKSIRAQWEQLTKAHPSLKDVVPSVSDPSGAPAYDAEARIKAMEKQLECFQSRQQIAKKQATNLQNFKDDLERLLKWFQWARDATIPKARADFSLTSLLEQLQELAVSAYIMDWCSVCGGTMAVSQSSMHRHNASKCIVLSVFAPLAGMAV